MSVQFRPMLASEADLKTLRFPLIASPKLDGVRALVKDGVLLSRSLKPIRNKHVQKLFGRPELEGLDGELIVGSPTAEDVYRVTQGATARAEGEPDVAFYAFDFHDDGDMSYRDRWGVNIPGSSFSTVLIHESCWIDHLEGLLKYERKCLDKGYEGLILRDPNSPYKFGRSTTKEGILLKLKRFKDSEARIIEVEELQHNGNEAQTNELGRTKRSSHKANQVPMGTMGALFVEDIHTGQRFKIGTGFSAAERQEFWDKRAWLCSTGVLVKYKFFPIGVKDLPRHPTYLGLRDSSDL